MVTNFIKKVNSNEFLERKLQILFHDIKLSLYF